MNKGYAALGAIALGIGAFILWGPAPNSRKKGKVTGIKNLGYTCFLNCLLQALSACPTFIIWLKEQRKRKTSSTFINDLVEVIDKINGYSEDLYGDVTPIDVITSLGPRWIFNPGHQDAHELFHIILNALQNEIQSLNKKGCLSDALKQCPDVQPDVKGSGDLSTRSVSCSNIAQAEVASINRNPNNNLNLSSVSISHFSNRHLFNIKPGVIIARSSEILLKKIDNSNDDDDDKDLETKAWNSLCSVLQQTQLSIPNISNNQTHPFSGLLTSQLKCSNCNWKSPIRYDKSETISLPLPPASELLTWRRHTLIDLFSRLVTDEMINNVDCHNCSTRCSAMKTLTLGKLPKCLCLHIPRTTWSQSGVPIKRDDPVIFPEILILDPFTFTEVNKRNYQSQRLTTMIYNNGKYKYKLVAVIEHRGPVDAGHFVSYRRGNSIKQWLYTSDTVVESTLITTVLSANPYMLFYEKISI